MRFAPGTLFVFLAGGASVAGTLPRVQSTSSTNPAASPSPSASPSPTLRYKLIPYGFESAKDRSTVPLLRFEDATEVRSLEMNAAIARFFDKNSENGDMMRGATPGGAPTLADMKNYRPHLSPSIDFLSLAMAAVKGIRNRLRNQEMLPAETPTPSPSSSPSPSPSPSPKV